MLILVTTCNRAYRKPWVFPSLAALSCRVVCLLHPEDDRPLPANAQRHPYDTPGCLYQDGRFLDAVPDVRPDDVVILADADGIFQRDFSDAERETLEGLGDGIALGYNVQPGQRGETEYHRLYPHQPLDAAAAALGLSPDILRGAWIYNTGFMAARVSTWRRVRALYAETVGDQGADLFQLHSWPQYFLCLTFCRHNLLVTELGYETHSHGHCPLTPRHAIRGRELRYDGELVLYAHNVMGVSHG